MNGQWFTRDMAFVVQAARAHRTEPLYAERLWEEAEDPRAACLFLLDLLIRERMTSHAPTG